jgi:hypothetical protein
MTNSIQVITGPTLRQFATIFEHGELVVTSKLGQSTLSRVRFLARDYPADPDSRSQFIKDRVLDEFPVVAGVLGSMLDKCISDQALAVNNLMDGR